MFILQVSGYAREATPLTALGHDMIIQSQDPFLGFDDGFDDIFMGNFLNGIINANPGGDPMPSSSIDILPDVLNFGFDGFAGSPSSITPIQTGGPVQEKDRPSSSRGSTETPAVRRAAHAGEQAFRESIWLWDPSMGDSSVSEQIHLALPRDHSDAQYHIREVDAGLRISTMTRDRLLSMILSTCELRVQRQVVRCFPSTEFLSCLLADCQSRHALQISPWIHFPTLDLDNESEEFLAALICAGAADSRLSAVRKLGFALQEATRLAIMKKFEEDNRHLRDLRSIQALLLLLIVGLNSASRRKIEIAESSTLAAVTMLRRGGRFWNTRDNLSLLRNDETHNQSPEIQWNKWAEDESYKRLAYHVLFQDVQTSSALYRQPVISYSEVNLTMPCSEEVWQAKSAAAWQQQILTRRDQPSVQPLTLHSCIKDLGLLSLYRGHIDVRMSLRVMVTIFWSRVWQFIQMRSISSLEENSSSAGTTNFLQQKLVATSQDIIVRFYEDPNSMHPCVKMMLEVGLMHLHVSLEDIQHLAGKEGEEHARRAATRLRSWIGQRDSRQALFHAGQIAKAAAQCPSQYLRGFHAVMIYHASLTMWAYALLATSQTASSTSQRPLYPSADIQLPGIRLDGDETSHLKRFILLGIGNARIQRYSNGSGSSLTDEPPTISLTDAAEVMRSMAGLLSSLDKSEHYCVPIVSYLTRLMHSLAKASAAMKLLR
jgi:hypothetical protein